MIFLSRVTSKFDGWPWKTIRHLFCSTLSFVHHFKAMGEFNLELQSGNIRFGSKSTIFCPMWPWNLTDDLENNRAPVLCCFKLCVSFHSHWRIETGVTVWKRPIWVKIDIFLSPVSLKFDEWPWKTIGHLSYAASRFVYHFIAIGVFKLQLQSGNGQFGSNQNPWFFAPSVLEIWRMTLKNNRTHLLCSFKVCVSFHSNCWIQTGVTVRKRPIWVKIDDFFSCVTLKFDVWPWKTIGHLF